jgi:hypothetical protein
MFVSWLACIGRQNACTIDAEMVGAGVGNIFSALPQNWLEKVQDFYF